MLRPPKRLDPARPCPLIVLLPEAPTATWEDLADREHAVVVVLDKPVSVSSLRTQIEAATRRFAVGLGQSYLVGSNTPELAAEVSVTTTNTSPDVWPSLAATKRSLPPAVETRLTVVCDGLRTRNGKLLGALYRAEKSFGRPGESIVASTKLSADAARLTFERLPHGEVALMIFHDENENGKLDTGLFGIPKEGFGASNDPKMRMGPPRWRECRFLLTGSSPERELSVRLRYL